MIAENSRSIHQCACGKFLGRVTAHCYGPPGDERVEKVTGYCSEHGEVDSTSPWDWEEFFPEEVSE